MHKIVFAMRTKEATKKELPMRQPIRSHCVIYRETNG